MNSSSESNYLLDTTPRPLEEIRFSSTPMPSKNVPLDGPTKVVSKKVPKMLELICEAVKAVGIKRKGASYSAIKKWIIESGQKDKSGSHFLTSFKRSFERGIETEVLKRSALSKEQTGLRGFFVLGKDQKKEKAKETKADKERKAANAAIKNTAKATPRRISHAVIIARKKKNMAILNNSLRLKRKSMLENDVETSFSNKGKKIKVLKSAATKSSKYPKTAKVSKNQPKPKTPAEEQPKATLRVKKQPKTVTPEEKKQPKTIASKTKQLKAVAPGKNQSKAKKQTKTKAPGQEQPKATDQSESETKATTRKQTKIEVASEKGSKIEKQDSKESTKKQTKNDKSNEATAPTRRLIKATKQENLQQDETEAPSKKQAKTVEQETAGPSRKQGKTREQDETAGSSRKQAKTVEQDETAGSSRKQAKTVEQDETAGPSRKQGKTVEQDETAGPSRKQGKTREQDETAGRSKKQAKTIEQDGTAGRSKKQAKTIEQDETAGPSRKQAKTAGKGVTAAPPRKQAKTVQQDETAEPDETAAPSRKHTKTAKPDETTAPSRRKAKATKPEETTAPTRKKAKTVEQDETEAATSLTEESEIPLTVQMYENPDETIKPMTEVLSESATLPKRRFTEVINTSDKTKDLEEIKTGTLEETDAPIRKKGKMASADVTSSNESIVPPAKKNFKTIAQTAISKKQLKKEIPTGKQPKTGAGSSDNLTTKEKKSKKNLPQLVVRMNKKKNLKLDMSDSILDTTERVETPKKNAFSDTELSMMEDE